MKKEEIPPAIMKIINDPTLDLSAKKKGVLIAGAPELNSLTSGLIYLSPPSCRNELMRRIDKLGLGVDWQPFIEMSILKVRRNYDNMSDSGAEV